jgi:hypothetical protein
MFMFFSRHTLKLTQCVCYEEDTTCGEAFPTSFGKTHHRQHGVKMGSIEDKVNQTNPFGEDTIDLTPMFKDGDFPFGHIESCMICFIGGEAQDGACVRWM